MIFPILALASMVTGTRFHVVEQNGISFLEGSDGKPFFSLGVCCVGTGESFLDYDLKNPSYAAYRYYPEGKEAWAEDTVRRLQSWGFNTIGAWSDAKTLRTVNAPELHFTPILHMGSGAGAPWRDMWDPKIVATMDAIARDQIKDLKSDPRVIGYFSDNEQGWWNAALFDWAWKGPYTRVRLVNQLRHRYKTWDAMCADFVPDQASGFTELAKKGRLYLKPGEDGITAIHAYMRLLTDRYYSLCRSIIKKYDPGALYFGDRFISNFYPEVAESAGKYCDVVSTNLNPDWNDGTFSPFYLDSLHRHARKPLMITEYYMCAEENRSGNKNDSSGFPVVKTQEERARGFTTSTTALLSTPYVVGTHWFQYFDEPKNGRGDGENYDFGLVDINNEPYDELTEAAKRLDLTNRKLQPASGSKSIPEIAPDDSAELGNWPRRDAYVKPVTPSDRGDAFVAWTPKDLLIAIYWNEDRFAEAFYKGGKVPEVEEPTLSIQWLSSRTSVRLIEGKPKVVGQIQVATLKMGVRNTAIIRVPASAFNLAEFGPGRRVSLELLLQTRSRAYSVHWKIDKALSD